LGRHRAIRRCHPPRSHIAEDEDPWRRSSKATRVPSGGIVGEPHNPAGSEEHHDPAPRVHLGGVEEAGGAAFEEEEEELLVGWRLGRPRGREIAPAYKGGAKLFREELEVCSASDAPSISTSGEGLRR
jgi:hypothetical protein